MQLRSFFKASTNITLSEAFQRVQEDDFNFEQKVKLHPQFTDYTLEKNVYFEKQHEAGYDSMMTGILWFKL